MPLSLPRLKYRSSPNFSERSGPIDLVILHDTEGSYQSAIDWFASKSSEVSAHLVLREDGLEATQMVPYSKKAWHAVSFNGEAIGIEMAGFASKRYSSSELQHAARLIAYFCWKFSIPPKFVHPTRIRGARGWTCHQSLGALGGGHHDPGFSRTKLWWFARQVKKHHRDKTLRRTGYGLN